MTPILLLSASMLMAATEAPSIEVHRDDPTITINIDIGRELQPYAGRGSGNIKLIRTIPEWPWECAISDLTEISCRAPSATVPSATAFRVELLAPLYDRNGERIPALTLDADTGAPEFRLGTRWTDAEPHLVAEADQPVDAASLQAALRVSTHQGAAGGQVSVMPIPAELLEDYERRSGADNRYFELRLDALAPGARYELSIEAGVRSLEGPLPGTGGESIAVEMPGPMYLELKCGASHGQQLAPPCDPRGGATLIFHGQPDASSLSAVIKAVVAAGISVDDELTRVWSPGYGPPQFQLDLGDLKSSRNYRIEWPSLRDSQGLPAQLDTKLALVTRQRQPRLTLDPAVALAPMSPVLWVNGVRRPLLTQNWLDAKGARHQQKFSPWHWRAPADPIAFPLPKPPQALLRDGGVEWLRASQGAGRVETARSRCSPSRCSVTTRAWPSWRWHSAAIGAAVAASLGCARVWARRRCISPCLLPNR